VDAYLLFAAKAVTVAVLVLMPFLLVFGRRAGRRHGKTGFELEVDLQNQRYERTRQALEAVTLPTRERRRRRRARRPERGTKRPRLFMCQFKGDSRARAVGALGEEITAILSTAETTDEVVVQLESAGGAIPGYGLAASQLERVRARGLRLTVLVDKIAASGGYMMACVAHRIVAAPFAIVGSIGVVAELPNFHRLLKKHDIDYEQLTAGRYKRTLSLFGDNASAGRAKAQADLEDAHALFKDFVREHRPQVDIDELATGEYWFARRALELGLVDRLATSDEFIGEHLDSHEIYRVRARPDLSWHERLWQAARAAADFS